MPLYYFHLRDHVERLLDPQGLSINDPAKLGERALKEARAIISQDALAGVINLDQRIEVEDESHSVVYVLPFVDAVRIVRDGHEHSGGQQA